ncbi:MAG: MBL fold metallo-hydrolase [Bacteroidota bacterium]
MSTIRVIDLHFLGNRETIAAFLVETTAGPVLIETGPHSTLAHLEKGLARHGYQCRDVQHVFLTHIHLDHAGAAWYFASLGATVYVHPRGHKHLANPEKLMNSARMIYRDKMDELWGEMRPIPDERLRAVADGEAFAIGERTFRAHHTPGHAVHHIAWQLDDQLFAGDVAGVRIGLGPVVPPCPPPDINVEDWQASIRKILALDLKEVHLTHYGTVREIEAHFQALENNLLEWATWMKPHFDGGSDPQEITPVFQAYVKESLIAAGVDAEGLRQYEGANPAWMSVVGLLRYWKVRARAASDMAKK